MKGIHHFIIRVECDSIHIKHSNIIYDDCRYHQWQVKTVINGILG